MTKLEKKIEAALQDWFVQGGWSIDERGDHFAICDDVDINITSIARHVTAEIEQC